MTLTQRKHDEDRLWNCTPRELAGRMYFSNRIKKREMADDLLVSRMAAHGDQKTIKNTLKDLEKD